MNSELNFHHPAWTISQTPVGLELQYRNWKSRGSHFALFPLSIWFTFCLWGIWGFLKNWIIDRAEILPAGVVLFLLLLGGFWLGIVLTGNFYERCVYLLSSATFKLQKYRIDRSTKEYTIEKSSIKNVYRLYTPSKDAGINGTWRTVIGYSDRDGKNKEIALAGHSEEEAEFLGKLFAEWSGLKVKKENTNG